MTVPVALALVSGLAAWAAMTARRAWRPGAMAAWSTLATVSLFGAVLGVIIASAP